MTARGNREPGADFLTQSRRLVIKIGSALLVDDESGDVRRGWLDALADDVAMLRARGIEILIVSSGAIAVGRPGEAGGGGKDRMLGALRCEGRAGDHEDRGRAIRKILHLRNLPL